MLRCCQVFLAKDSFSFMNTVWSLRAFVPELFMLVMSSKVVLFSNSRVPSLWYPSAHPHL